MRIKDDMIFMELDTHEKYEKLLFQLRKMSNYVQLIQIDGYDNKDPHILIADQTLEKTDMGETRAWLGTTRRGKASFQHRYRITDKSFFDYLMQFENFFNLEGTVNKISLKSFGTDDIAFFDKDQCPLFYTVTHEGLAFVHPDVLRVDVSFREKTFPSY